MERTVGIMIGSWGILINICMYLAIVASYYVKKKDKVPTALLYIILANSAIQISETVSWYFEGKTSGCGIVGKMLADYIYFISMPFLAISFNYYIECIIKWYGGRINTIYFRMLVLVGSVLDILITINLFTKWFYYADQNNIYRRTPLFPIVQIVQLFIILVIVLRLLNAMKTDAVSMIKRHFSIFAILVPVALYQWFFYRVSVLGMGFTFAIFILYALYLKEQTVILANQEKQLEQLRLVLKEQEQQLIYQEQKLEETKEELVQARIQVLIAQIKPHFLYNTIAMIRNCCFSDPTAAADALGKFAKFLRGAMQSLNTTNCISLQEELELVHAYVYLQQMRFGDRLSYIEEIEEREVQIPALSIQIYVENAIRHGIEGNEDGGTVKLHVYRTENEVVITITDDGVGYDVSKPIDESKHVGTKNVRERLIKMCNGQVNITSEIGKGTEVTVRIPDQNK